MSVHWSKQAITYHQRWFARIWQSVGSELELRADARVLDKALANTDKAFKHDRTTTVSRIDLPSYSIVLKRYNPRTLGHAFSRALRRSRASRCWKMSYAFDRAGLKVAAPILMLERRIGPVRLNAYFANELLPGSELLVALPALPPAEQQEVLAKMRLAFERMRQAKLTHGDMKASNLIWHSGELYFIDLDAAKKHRSMVGWNASHQRDRLRFQKNWQGHPDLVQLFADL